MQDENNSVVRENATPVATAEAPIATAAMAAAEAPAEALQQSRFSQISEEKRRAAAKKRRKRRIVKWTIIGVVILVIAAASAFGIWKLFFEPVPPVPPQTSFSYRSPFSQSISGWGQVKATSSEAVTAPARGELLELYVAEGDMVYEGQPLFVMDDSVLRDQVATAEKQLETLRDQLTSQNDSLRKAYENRQKVAATTTDYYDGLAEIAGKLRSRNLTAPFNGKVLELSVKEGDTVSEGQVIATLVRDEELVLKQYYSYAYEHDIYIGMSADVSIPSSMEVLKGTVTEIDKVKRVTAEGGVLFSVTVSVKNPGALAEGTQALATLKAPGLSISPAESAKFEYSRTEQLTAPARGKILSLNIKAFASYNSGAVLYTLSDDGYSDQQRQLENQIESVNGQLEGFDDQISTYLKQIGSSEETIAEKIEEIDELYTKFDDFNAVAPMSGMVTAITASIGQTMEEKATILVVSDTSAMTLEVQFDERDVSKVSIGTMASLTSETSEGTQYYMGTVTYISLEGKYDWGYAYFPGAVTINGGEGLRSGSSMNFSIVLESKDDCVLVPIAAVKYTDSGPAVFVKLPEGFDAPPEGVTVMELPEGIVPEGFYAVPVVTGLSDNTQIEIVDGITDGVEMYIQPGDPNAVQDNMGGRGGMATAVRFG